MTMGDIATDPRRGVSTACYPKARCFADLWEICVHLAADLSGQLVFLSGACALVHFSITITITARYVGGIRF